jgi:hypothetical protein
MDRSTKRNLMAQQNGTTNPRLIDDALPILFDYSSPIAQRASH